MARHKKFFTRDRIRSIRRFVRVMDQTSAAMRAPPSKGASAVYTFLCILVVIPAVLCIVAMALRVAGVIGPPVIDLRGARPTPGTAAAPDAGTANHQTATTHRDAGARHPRAHPHRRDH